MIWEVGAVDVGASHWLARPTTHLELAFAMRNTRHTLPVRRSLRLHGYDYRSSCAYFVTICTAEKQPLFAGVRDGRIQHNELGQIAESCWQQIERIRTGIALDAYIVMPNHVHGILLFSGEDVAVNTPTAGRGLAAGSLGAVLAQYKSAVTKQSRFIESPPTDPIWQRNYHDHIIRSSASLDRIRRYIIENPARWEDDEMYVG